MYNCELKILWIFQNVFKGQVANGSHLSVKSCSKVYYVYLQDIVHMASMVFPRGHKEDVWNNSNIEKILAITTGEEA